MKKYRLMIVVTVVGLSLALTAFPPMTVFPQTAPRALMWGTLAPGSNTYQDAVAIAEIIKKHSDLSITMLPQSGQSAYLRLLNEGRLHLANGDGPQLRLARLNEEPYKGNAPPLRAIFIYDSGSTYAQTFLTGRDTNIFKLTDLKGKRVVAGYTANPSIAGGLRGLMANAGLTEADVIGVPVVNFAAGLRALIEKRVDVAVGVVGPNPLLQELEVSRGIRVIPMDESPAAIERAMKAYPGAVTGTVTRTHPRTIWVKEGIPDKYTGMSYQWMVVSPKSLSDEPIYKMAKSFLEHRQELADMYPQYKPELVFERMVSVNAPIPYHPGAIRYFKEAGLWTSGLETHQKKLIAENPGR